MDNKKQTFQGCLKGKTEKKIVQFFESLYRFKKTDSIFYQEQLHDLKGAEHLAYVLWEFKKSKEEMIKELQKDTILFEKLFKQHIQNDNNRYCKTRTRSQQTKARNTKGSKNKR